MHGAAGRQLNKRVFCHLAESGLSLVELIVTLALLSIVLAGAYMFYFFGHMSFVTAEGRSDVQKNVRMAADFISREIRHATRVHLGLPEGKTSIPHAAALEEDEHYIFLNADGLIEYRTKNVSRLIPGVISDKVEFDLSFVKSTTHTNVLSFRVDGTRDSGQTYSLLSEVFIENLGFLNSVITGGTSASTVYFIKQPSGLAFLSVSPHIMETGTLADKHFYLTLINDKFTALAVDDIELGLDFSGLTVTGAVIDANYPAKATVTLSGTLTHSDGSGTITVSGNATESTMARTAQVLVVVPVGILLALPSEVEEDENFQQVFTLGLENNIFKDSVLENDIFLGDDFSGLEVTSVMYINPSEIKVTVKGNLEHVTGNGLIQVTAGGLGGGSALSANVIVWPNGEGPNPPPVEYTLTMGVYPAGKGSTIPAAGYTYSYAAQSKVTISATGLNDWEFYKWEIGALPAQYNAVYELDMNGNKTALAHFRLPLAKIPLGSYVRYDNKDYIKLAHPNKVMDRNASTSDVKWTAGSSWPSKDELTALTQAQRGGVGDYWTSTSDPPDNHNSNFAWYVKNDGSFESRNKNNSYKTRLTHVLQGNISAYSGSGTDADPYRLQLD